MVNRVLVVEDNPVVREVMVRLLASLGVNCYSVVSAEEAIGLAQYFDLILMDVQLPGMSGIEATVEIRKQEEKRRLERVRIVAITCNGSRIECMAAGMDDYFVKPINRQKLSDILKQWLFSQPQKERALG